jgi:hypothetical protein
MRRGGPCAVKSVLGSRIRTNDDPTIEEAGICGGRKQAPAHFVERHQLSVAAYDLFVKETESGPLMAAQQERLGSFQMGRRLYPDFQITGTGVANLTHVAGESFFRGH